MNSKLSQDGFTNESKCWSDVPLSLVSSEWCQRAACFPLTNERVLTCYDWSLCISGSLLALTMRQWMAVTSPAQMGVTRPLSPGHWRLLGECSTDRHHQSE